ncbi:alpha/beta-hydrolase [Fomitiporia mediterranea MF3/22]|uniref:alpha/beta-hydrolase n=1 Tax=Fomitiporia mediterranea (strain MF3/22) TaxID=694068 RepID=UPI0004407308|nr:alpha/beta-hydrolase [Fomitiporia mediterranea MF3/22]EJD00106.1 alpha/beta-hydrolase [Fomitiporia mediterranea MF3/22]
MDSSSTPTLSSETFLVDSTPSFDLKVLAKRYVPNPPFKLSSSPHAITLVCFHATGFFKETWEPLLQRLLSRLQETQDAKSSLQIGDIFSIESPNHGESAVLNEEVLERVYGDTWSNSIYSRAAMEFLTAGEERGAKIDFSKRRLVGVGHSMGAAAMVMLVNMAPSLHFERLICIEAAVSRPDIPGRFEMSKALTYLAWTRKDVWTSHKSAMKEFKSNPVYSQWDPRIFELFSRYALRTHPAARYAEPYCFKGITTALTKRQEAACYRDEELVYRALKEYAELTRKMPVHVIFGDTPDISPGELQSVHTDKDLGCYPTSVSYVRDVGHLAVQQAPDATADEIFEVLKKFSASNRSEIKAAL